MEKTKSNLGERIKNWDNKLRTEDIIKNKYLLQLILDFLFQFYLIYLNHIYSKRMIVVEGAVAIGAGITIYLGATTLATYLIANDIANPLNFEPVSIDAIEDGIDNEKSTETARLGVWDFISKYNMEMRNFRRTIQYMLELENEIIKCEREVKMLESKLKRKQYNPKQIKEREDCIKKNVSEIIIRKKEKNEKALEFQKQWYGLKYLHLLYIDWTIKVREVFSQRGMEQEFDSIQQNFPQDKEWAVRFTNNVVAIGTLQELKGGIDMQKLRMELAENSYAEADEMLGLINSYERSDERAKQLKLLIDVINRHKNNSYAEFCQSRLKAHQDQNDTKVIEGAGKFKYWLAKRLPFNDEKGYYAPEGKENEKKPNELLKTPNASFSDLILPTELHKVQIPNLAGVTNFSLAKEEDDLVDALWKIENEHYGNHKKRTGSVLTTDSIEEGDFAEVTL